MENESLVFVIPIVGIVFGVTCGAIAMYFNYRRQSAMIEAAHKERMAAIEKGLELPPLPVEPCTVQARLANPRRNLLKGLVWLFIGLGVLGALGAQGDTEEAYWGLIPAGIGLAYLIYYFAVGRKEAEQMEAARSAETNQGPTVCS
jgi:preprotein translocase subunit YajC